MSYRIEYQWGVFHVPAASTGLAEDRFVVAIEGGDNNLYEGKSGRRVRTWNACMIGTASQVLKRTVSYADACEGGSLQPYGRCCTPEAYIRRIRRLIEGPAYLQRGWWYPHLRVDPTHVIVADAQRLGMKPEIEQRYGRECAVISVPQERYAEFFQLVDQYARDLPAWCLAEVAGLPSS